MSKLRLVLIVVGLSVFLVGVMVFGLSKLGGSVGKTVDVEQLVNGARWVTEKGKVKVTVVEFSDLQCPACKQAEKIAKQVRDMDGVRFVYRQFPLTNIHKNAMISAVAIEVAREKGKGWELLEKLFDRQDEWAEKTNKEMRVYLGEMGMELGLDGSELVRFLDDPKYKDGVMTDLSLAEKLVLPGTPTFFVDGEKVNTDQLIEVVKTNLGK